jgi:phospholipase C
LVFIFVVMMLPQVYNTPPPALHIGHPPHLPWTGSLKDVNHVVLFMQENRAFDHVSDQP